MSTMNNLIKKHGRTALVLASVALATGCGAFDTDEKGRKVDQVDSELAGTWRSACLSGDWLGLTRSTETYVFSAVGDFDKSTVVYDDEACTQPGLETKVKGTTDVLGASPNVVGAKDINFTISDATLTPRSDKAAKLLTDVSYCGVGTWTRDVGVDILAKDCLGEEVDRGEVVFDVYKLDDKELRLGANMIFLDKSDASDRPTKLEETRVFVKQ